METGELNERIKIYTPKDGCNLTSLSNYIFFKEVWCNVKQVTTREQLRSGVEVQSGQMTVLLRYLTGLSDDCLILWQDNFYAIDNLAPNKQKGEIVLGCSFSGLNENQRITT